MDRRRFLAALGGGAVAAAGAAHCVAPARQATVARRPNIVLILADDLGYGDIGVQGCPDIPTPHIDSIAAAGVRFTDGYVSCPVCAPTRAGLMTSRYQQRFGFEFNPGPVEVADAKFGLPTTETTLAERLKALGYATGMFGKWHLGYQPGLRPTERGFDEFYGFLSGAHAYLPQGNTETNPILRGTEVVEAPEHLTSALGREAVSFIESHAEEPFFLYLPFNAVHAPLEAPAEYAERFAGIADPKRRTHAAMLAAMDDSIGGVLDALDRHALAEDTLVVFLSDNGGPTSATTSLNDPLRGFKGQVLEGGIRVPFMARWPGRIPSGTVYGEPVISLDVGPTALGAAGADAAEGLDGVDLLPFVNGTHTGCPHETLCWRFGEQWAIREGDWKLTLPANETRPALYNLTEDIAESTDLSATEPERLAGLTARYRAWDAELAEPRWKREKTPAAGQARRTVEERFAELDRDGDGRLSEEELGRPRVFGRADADGDGFLTLEEARGALGRG